MKTKNGSFTMKSESAVVVVRGIHKIPWSRRYVEAAERAVLSARVQKGILKEGDEIVLKSPAGEELNDIAARIEINRQRHPEVSAGNNVGILLMKHAPENLIKFGLPLLRVRSSVPVREVLRP